MQFTLSRAGHEVHAVDPGMSAKGKGWRVDADFHGYLAKVYRAPVQLWPTTIGRAGFAEASFDVLLSISTIEHFAAEDLAEFAAEVRRLLKPNGLLVLTIDLFLDVEPFTTVPANRFGRNINIKALLESCGTELVVGSPAELYGFDEFDHHQVQSNLSSYLIGSYPGLAQCLVGRAGG